MRLQAHRLQLFGAEPGRDDDAAGADPAAQRQRIGRAWLGQVGGAVESAVSAGTDCGARVLEALPRLNRSAPEEDT